MLAELLGSDPYAGYIAACYGLSFLVLGSLSFLIARDLRQQWKLLRALEQETGKQRWS